MANHDEEGIFNIPEPDMKGPRERSGFIVKRLLYGLS